MTIEFPMQCLWPGQHDKTVTSERSLETKVHEYVESLGGRCKKLKDTEKGFPDRTILLPGGITIYLELKKPGCDLFKELSPHQKKQITELHGLGFNVGVSSSLEAVKGHVLDILFA